jgi:hypothetical protein
MKDYILGSEEYIITSMELVAKTIRECAAPEPRNMEQEEANEVETEIPPKGRIILKKDGQIMYGVPYEGVYDFDNVHSEVFVQLLQRKKDGGNWVIEVVPF